MLWVWLNRSKPHALRPTITTVIATKASSRRRRAASLIGERRDGQRRIHRSPQQLEESGLETLVLGDHRLDPSANGNHLVDEIGDPTRLDALDHDPFPVPLPSTEAAEAAPPVLSERLPP